VSAADITPPSADFGNDVCLGINVALAKSALGLRASGNEPVTANKETGDYDQNKRRINGGFF
jgi:hypothetical protein